MNGDLGQTVARHDERLKVVEKSTTQHETRLDDLERWRAKLVGYALGGAATGAFLANMLFEWVPKLIK
ncbi:MAG: hypothetical protein M5U09_13605 [Gammaproteobacteria bacterium]|nr:hypothetical protein [Gammaproteobacteria bacterium]